MWDLMESNYVARFGFLVLVASSQSVPEWPWCVCKKWPFYKNPQNSYFHMKNITMDHMDKIRAAEKKLFHAYALGLKSSNIYLVLV